MLQQSLTTRAVVITGDLNLESLIPAANGWTYEVFILEQSQMVFHLEKVSEVTE